MVLVSKVQRRIFFFDLYKTYWPSRLPSRELTDERAFFVQLSTCRSWGTAHRLDPWRWLRTGAFILQLIGDYCLSLHMVWSPCGWRAIACFPNHGSLLAVGQVHGNLSVLPIQYSLIGQGCSVVGMSLCDVSSAALSFGCIRIYTLCCVDWVHLYRFALEVRGSSPMVGVLSLQSTHECESPTFVSLNFSYTTALTCSFDHIECGHHHVLGIDFINPHGWWSRLPACFLSALSSIWPIQNKFVPASGRWIGRATPACWWSYFPLLSLCEPCRFCQKLSKFGNNFPMPLCLLQLVPTNRARSQSAIGRKSDSQFLNGAARNQKVSYVMMLDHRCEAKCRNAFIQDLNDSIIDFHSEEECWNRT